jgi:formyltetrahydrofolate-dependent phosphoribosylglycinamide formyltransferase
MMSRIAVLASGGGSNLQAIHTYLRRTAAARIVLVASDRADSPALEWSKREGMIVEAIDGSSSGSARVLEILSAAAVDLVVLAGYLRLVPSPVVRAYRGRMINVHPALLPAFGGRGMYGARVHRAVLESGARVSGATVHFVDEQYDHGPIITQWPVPVFADDTERDVAARVLRAEHLLLPRVVHAVATGAVHLDDTNRVTYAHREFGDDAAFVFDRPNDDALSAAMASALGV